MKINHCVSCRRKKQIGPGLYCKSLDRYVEPDNTCAMHTSNIQNPSADPDANTTDTLKKLYQDLHDGNVEARKADQALKAPESEPEDDGKRACANCGDRYPDTKEFWYGNGYGGLRVDCKPCARKSNKAWRTKNHAYDLDRKVRWRLDNHEQKTAANRLYYQNNKEKWVIYGIRTRCNKLIATTGLTALQLLGESK